MANYNVALARNRGIGDVKPRGALAAPPGQQLTQALDPNHLQGVPTQQMPPQQTWQQMHAQETGMPMSSQPGFQGGYAGMGNMRPNLANQQALVPNQMGYQGQPNLQQQQATVPNRFGFQGPIRNY